MDKRPLWTAQELIGATGGSLHGQIPVAMNGVSLDSRATEPGDIFVAVKGDKLDGHDYVVRALENGASVAIVSQATDAMSKAGAILQVSGDPLQALQNIGRAARAWSPAQIIAVTGSVGKTSTKEMLRIALGASGDTHASAASFNNHWGVPLTLARLSRGATYGIFEIGMNHAGEITPLVNMVRPHIAVVTSVAASHLGHFNSLDEIADAKAEIFSGVEPGGSAVINQDSPYFEKLAAIARKFDIKSVIGFGHHADAGVRLERLSLHHNCCCVTADIMGEKVTYKLGVPGAHMAMNSLAVLATVKLAGADLARAALALAHAKPFKGRGIQERLEANGGEILLIDESYNANPASVAAALSLLGHARLGKHGRRIAVLGDMLELGQFAPALHADIAPALEEHHVDLLYAAGPLMNHLWENTPEAMRGAYAENSGELKDRLLKDIRAGDCIVIKGSLGSRMGLLVDALRTQFTAVKKES